MGKTQSVLEKKGYTTQKEVENGVIATDKHGDQFVIKEIKLNETSVLNSSVESLRQISHPHIVSYNNSFLEDNCYYIVTDHCAKGNLSQKIQEQMTNPTEEYSEKIMDWFVKICMALKHVHDQGLLHRELRPQSVLLTEFETLRLGAFGSVNEKTTNEDGMVGYLGPEILTGGTYDTKSDIWSLGCVLYELCMLQCAFTAENTIKLIRQILGGSYPSLPESFSSELRDLLCDIFQQDPTIRPSAGDIMAKPFIISFMAKKSEKTVEELQTSLDKLRTLADGLESIHKGTTIGSLTGGVIGAAGGITSIVGLILAPFTLGASLIVTGVGIGVAVAGGATAGVSNITNMVNQSTDRRAIKNIIKEFQEKMNSVVTSLQDIAEGLETLMQSSSSKIKSAGFNVDAAASAGVRAGKGLAGTIELFRLLRVANIGKVAAQTARAVRVAEVATGIFSAFFVAVDIFFIAMDARKIHNIRQAKSNEQAGDTSKLEVMDTDSTTELEPGCEEPKAEVKSETMKFIQTIRQTAERLQESLDELSDVISFIPKIEDCYLDD
uniref:serine/threonine-protein kinase PLK4-like isoform X1 n=1 Tax=Oncorhynchus gorbuscha TaxID=8017 RepID=UPI001EAF2076|nr:serine/threonine-protein kinase PLK4-like isoform X1 [Oncorhynchus gorbuscha]XP_046185666.1 serine/threonine-protein kinase PLK4-like isoform X1 [Oncorhynchus gorbuscha]XP_046185667.1 serine/threonine-protein kinase PLK4-like isoform X1 [Oncorhynchus gorbuscha]XP_046185668.1 serine/threonine-protein kinase PLK4-like isoform X1 [Oncorhynchus gorbuscha]XP_046185669.1 serine/threonine-protein kinase PLK4-like isoform X1 [Oncorhynchus gorbuscha]XP_046185670.1 serine/threonine-protein kinase PLK